MNSMRYDGTTRLFEIGMRPLDIADWIDSDERLMAYLEEKSRLRALRRDEVFAAEPDTEEAQAEVLAMLAAHLPERFPAIYRRNGETMAIVSAGRSVALDAAEAPLMIAASLIAEDLVLMRRGEAGWRLVAASLSFPSSWSLREKFGYPIEAVHGPVPGFGAGTRYAGMIARIFDNLRPEQPVIRWNWSLYPDADLFHPPGAASDGRRFGDGTTAIFLRTERQTLRKLVASGDILFTIGVRVDPIESLAGRSEGARIAASLAAQLGTLTDEQLAYKGLTLDRDRLLGRLAELTGE